MYITPRGPTILCTIGLLLILMCVRDLYAQYRFTGELRVLIQGSGWSTVDIYVDAESPVYGSRSDWFPVTTGRWDSYHTRGTFDGQHIDRGGGPNEDTIGYAKYWVMVHGQEVGVDFRDADYQGTYEPDIFLWYDLSEEKFYRQVDGQNVWMNSGEEFGVWDDGRKESGVPRIPVTVRNYWAGGYGGTVSIDGSWQSSPRQTIWSLESHTIEAAAAQGANWIFDHWSDGEARSHSVSASLNQFSKTYTAYYVVERRFSPPGGYEVESYPNPFNPVTSIAYTLRGDGHVHLCILDLLGRRVAVLVDEVQEAGEYRVKFDGTGLASGAYYCILVGQDGLQLLRILFMK